MKDELLSVADVAERLGVTETRVKQFIRAGRLKAERLGARAYIVKASDLKAFQKAPKLAPGRPPSAK